MSDMPAVRVEKSGPVTTVVLSRPAVRNAVDRPTAEALAGAFLGFEADADSRVAVLWGEHGTFCAGADLKAVAEGRGNRLQGPPEGKAFADLAADGPMGPTRLRLSKPVIAAVAGHAVAGGLELALWCDLRVVEQSAVFGVYCRRWGVPLVDGGTIRLPRLIGHGRAMDLILTGRPVAAQEALAIGLASRVVADGECRQRAEELAAEICGFPQLCLRSDRQSCLDQWSLDMSAALAREIELGRATIESGETRTGASRFAAGRGRGGRFDDI
jgi:enoyl-CoA hydratase